MLLWSTSSHHKLFNEGDIMKRITVLWSITMLFLVLTACAKDTDTSADSSSATKQDQAQNHLEEHLVDPDDIVATVNGTEVKGEEYNALIYSIQQELQASGANSATDDENLKNQVLDILIGNKLLLQDATSNNYKVSDKEVDDEFKSIKEQYGETQFNEDLEVIGSDVEKYKQQLKDSLLVSKYIEKELSLQEVTEKDIMAEYEEMKKQAAETETEENGEVPEYTEIQVQLKDILEQQNLQEAIFNRIDELKQSAEVKYNI